MKSDHLRSVLGALVLCLPWLSACATGDPGPPAGSRPPISPTWPMAPRTQLAAEPPPISGGSMLMLQDGHSVVAADADQDKVWIVDLTLNGGTVLGSVALQVGDEPGRMVQDAAGRIHVVLRRGGALATIDTSGAVTRRAVCPAPRGLAYDAALDAVHVACADGLLATFPAAGGAATASVRLDGDLRDVIVQGNLRYVSRFRAAELLEVAADGTVNQRITLPSATNPDQDGGVVDAVPSVAYRTVGLPDGTLAMLHQRALDAVIDTTPGGYTNSGMCPGSGIVEETITLIHPGTAPAIAPSLAMTTLAVDLAVSPDGTQVAVAAPGSMDLGSTLITIPMSLLETPGSAPPCMFPSGSSTAPGQPIAVAFDGQGRLVTQTRAPAAIAVGGTVIQLPSADTNVNDDGHATFHTGTKGGIACASCHPEGGDDGRVWQFADLGPRRTQNIRGGVLSRMPFHWSGDIADMDTLVSVVLEGRMGGPSLSEAQTTALGQWMDALPALAPPPPADPAAVARGAQTFADPNVGCATCHSGPQLSTHQLLDVGTGGVFKVPSLIAVGYRAPYLHDGCAATLLDRFGPSCGGGDQHGNTQQLDAGQISDLVAYLESL